MTTSAVRDYVLLYINGRRHEVRGEQAFMNLSDYLRYQAGLVGTKIVCAEGDCGACTILYARALSAGSGNNANEVVFKTINSCIQPVFNMDGCSVVSVEGLQHAEVLSSVQEAMVQGHGAQCGYCTPGICNSLTYLAEKTKLNLEVVSEKKAKNFLTGNLCRCTGYEPIIKAACEMDIDRYELLSKRYWTNEISADLTQDHTQTVYLQAQAKSTGDSACDELWLPATRQSLVARLGQGRLISGGTDLGVQRNKGRLQERRFISLQNMRELFLFEDRPTEYWIGAMVTWDQVESLVQPVFAELARLIHLFASPQIKHAGTLVGNLVNASPIADGVPFMLVNEAVLVVLGAHGKTREVALSDFYLGYKKIDLKKDEVVIAVRLPKNKSQQKCYKVSSRKDLDIATVNCAIRYELQDGKLSLFKIAYGGVAATALRVPALEKLFLGQELDSPGLVNLLQEADRILEQEIHPLSDVRGSADYRLRLCKNLLRKWVEEMKLQPELSLS